MNHSGGQPGKSEWTGVSLSSRNKCMKTSAGIHSPSTILGSGLVHPFLCRLFRVRFERSASDMEAARVGAGGRGCAAKGILRLFLCAAFCCVLASCDDASPKTCFDRAVLNCNLIHDFASKGLLGQLESPSAKLTDAKTGASAPMKRKEVIDDKIAFIEQSLEKVRKLRQTDDTRDIVQASMALHEYVLPVYRSEYQQLAKLHDDGAAKEPIEALASAITVKYRAGFEALSERLTTAGKAYASRHDIKVVWDVRASPSQ